jgi:hypothetical protein
MSPEMHELAMRVAWTTGGFVLAWVGRWIGVW